MNRYSETTMKRIKLILPIFFILLIIHKAASQTADSIIFVPDRPGMATPPNILTFEKLQIESGFQFENYTDGTVHYENDILPTLLIRIGLLKNAEVRISTDYAYNIETDSGISSIIKGLDPITLGTKIKVFKQRKLIPNLSVLINLTLPFYGKTEFRPDFVAPAVYLLMSNSIFDKLIFCYNYGLIWDGNKSPLTQFYALCLAFSLGKKLGFFAEGYGYSSKYERAKLYYDGGLAYLLNNHFQIDVSASGQFNSTNDYYLVNAGIAWQIPHKKMKF